MKLIFEWVESVKQIPSLGGRESFNPLSSRIEQKRVEERGFDSFLIPAFRFVLGHLLVLPLYWDLTMAILVPRLSNSDRITPPAFLCSQLAGGRLWTL
jgi:hypothetical protein